MSSNISSKGIGKVMLGAGWVLIMILLTLYFSDMQEKQNNPNQSPNSSSQNGINRVVLKRNRYHHYVSNGQINGQEVTFMVDTGATAVALSPQLAKKLGLKQGMAGYAQTANGRTRTYATVIDELKLGAITLYNVRASITTGMYDDGVLLGMSALKSVEFTHRDGTLTLTQYN